ncbi:MAG: dihydrodipicolinate synthase family protein, partial [Dehalococcoidia bacterium]
IIENTGDDFIVWSGNDTDTLPILALGGYGVISVASNIVGIQIKEMIESFISGETRKAAQIHRHLMPLINTLFTIANPMPIKYAMNHIGFKVGSPRPPLFDPDENVSSMIRETLKKYTIDLVIPD